MGRSAIKTKEQIKQAAIRLFSVQGFGSTSIREIAETAAVNPALVSYHFGNKQNILETIMVDYFEGLFCTLEQLQGSDQQDEEKDCFYYFEKTLEHVVLYQYGVISVSTIILRELSVDSMLVREIMSTYMTKLKAFFTHLLENGIACGQFRADLHVEAQVIQVLSVIFFPCLNPQLLREVFYVEPTSEQFWRQYSGNLSKNWRLILKNEEI